jgi:ADP-heptose:LPS heptosyltransferase
MKILLIQLRSIGDVVCMGPAIKQLRDALPKATIDFLVEPASFPIVEKNPHLNTVLVYDKKTHFSELRRIRSRGYDAVLDFMSNPRTTAIALTSGAKWRAAFKVGPRSLLYNVRVAGLAVPEYVPKRRVRLVQEFLSKIGVTPVWPASFTPELFLTDDDKRFADDWLKKEGVAEKSFAVIAPVHKHAICRWRPEGFKAVAGDLVKKGLRVYVMWGPGEDALLKELTADYRDQIGFLPPNDLRKIAAVLQKARLFVANNSGSMHMAVAVGTPTVTIYGPTRAVDWNPASADPAESKRHVAMMAANVACLGCRLKTCPVGHLCMTELKEKTVIQAVSGLIPEYGSRPA